MGRRTAQVGFIGWDFKKKNVSGGKKDPKNTKI